MSVVAFTVRSSGVEALLSWASSPDAPSSTAALMSSGIMPLLSLPVWALKSSNPPASSVRRPPEATTSAVAPCDRYTRECGWIV